MCEAGCSKLTSPRRASIPCTHLLVLAVTLQILQPRNLEPRHLAGKHVEGPCILSDPLVSSDMFILMSLENLAS